LQNHGITAKRATEEGESSSAPNFRTTKTETMMQNIHSTNKAVSELIDNKVSNLAVLNFAIWLVVEIALMIAAFVTLESGYMAAALVACFAGALPISLEVLSDELKKEG
jgi:hypothetical protein